MGIPVEACSFPFPQPAYAKMVLAKPNYFKDEVTPLKTNEVIPKLSSSGRLNDGLIIILMMKMMIKKKYIYIYIDYVNLKGCLDNF